MPRTTKTQPEGMSVKRKLLWIIPFAALLYVIAGFISSRTVSADESSAPPFEEAEIAVADETDAPPSWLETKWGKILSRADEDLATRLEIVETREAQLEIDEEELANEQAIFGDQRVDMTQRSVTLVKCVSNFLEEE